MHMARDQSNVISTAIGVIGIEAMIKNFASSIPISFGHIKTRVTLSEKRLNLLVDAMS
jgi:hypothetical protein